MTHDPAPSTFSAHEPSFLTPKQAAGRLQISEATIYLHIKARTGPWTKLGRLWRIPTAQLETWAQSLSQA